jgi:hypothetical protein
MAAGRGTIGFLFAIVLRFQLEFYLFGFSFYHQHYIINLASAAGAEVFQIPPQRQAVTLCATLFLDTSLLFSQDKRQV